MIQLLIALFGVIPVSMAMSRNDRARKWAPLVGLAGQPVWAAFAWQTNAWGLGVACVAFTAAYMVGVWVQWNVRRWLWQRIVRKHPAHRCADCGCKLTADELKYYGHWCNRCEGIAMEQMESVS